MNQTDFGKFLREKRKKYGKTQEEIANHIGKNKMLISGMETGKNNPPKGEDLDKMIEVLGLDKLEIIEFRSKAAFERDTLPNEIIEMIKKDSRILEILYRINEKHLTEEKYNEIKQILDKL